MKRVPLEERMKRKPVDSLFQPTDEPADKQRPLKKLTVYIPPEHYLAIEEMQLAELKRTGKKPDKMDLFKEALDLLIEKHRHK